MKEHQDAGGVSAGDDRPFARNAVEIDRLELDVLSDRPNRADLIEAAAALRPADRPRLGAEKRANSVDFGFRHGHPLLSAAHSMPA